MATAGLSPTFSFDPPFLDRTRSLPGTEDGDTGESCRICRGEATLDQPLFYPCKCSGSIKYVHQECLMEWLSHSQKKYCELCKTPFTFTKLYDQSMPETLPLPLFLRQLGLYGIRTLGKWSRYTLVIFIWTCWLPWSIRQIWRGLFWLADGSWMTAEDLEHLGAIDKVATTINATLASTANAVAAASAAAASDSPVTQTIPVTFFDPLGEIVSLLSGARLLRGIVRLVSAQEPPVPAPTVGLHANETSSLLALSTARRPSLLSDVESLNSLTRYPLLNNALIDILEGQLVCLSVIAAFILIFLIREWVINQQPILNMPDPDQQEAAAPALVPAAPVDQDENAHQPARRRLRPFQRMPDQDDPEEDIVLNVAQRPHAIPRLRRPMTENNVTTHDQPLDVPDRPTLEPRSATYAHVTSNIEEAPAPHAGEHVTGRAQGRTSLPDFQSPPLQRGIFGEVVDIRRNIEEKVNEDGEDVMENELFGSTTPTNSTNIGSAQLSVRPRESHPFADTFDFGQPANTEAPFSSDFTFVQPSSLVGSGYAVLNETGALSQYRVNEGEDRAVPLHDVDQPRNDTTGSVSNSTSSSSWQQDFEGASDIEVTNSLLTPNDVADLVPAAAPQLTPHIVEIRGFWDNVAHWLWYTEHYVPGSEPATPVDRGTTADTPNVEGPAAPAAVDEQQQVAGQPNEPNIQFGADVNDPNAIDDAEDLEGILELIGMEGPIAGMIQNIIFSVFLITLTLSASVWCPYIWGKIALLVMSNPIGVFFKAPLYFVSRCADILVDMMLLIIGGLGYMLANIAQMAKLAIASVIPPLGNLLNVSVVQELALNVSTKSSQRLEKALSGTVFHLRPDLPTFSMQSHYALRVFKKAASEAWAALCDDTSNTFHRLGDAWNTRNLIGLPTFVVGEVVDFPKWVYQAFTKGTVWFDRLSHDLRMPAISDATTVDYTLIDWDTRDRVLAVLIGYAFFAVAGFAYLKLSRLFSGAKPEDKAEGVFADSLRQAGGVMKVIVIIGIEMIVFPLYCGLLLDVALLPLFKNASFASRISFMCKAPVTAVFIHWFIGTCYMFHFALFVSMCRKILRKGVLYFIRDPDDPTFHPVRDVLERPVAMQLGKIAFSACVYGALVIFCLGGVVWAIGGIGGVFPIRWTIDEPRLAFPVDIVFYNFILPFVVRKSELSKSVSALYGWWFRGCARMLRLSHFLFGEERHDEKTLSHQLGFFNAFIATQREGQTDKQASAADKSTIIEGSWVRVPASDSVRIPKGTKVFLEVDADNNRLDGQPDRDSGLHGKKDERFAKVYVPPRFKLRISAFVFLVWLFAAATGTAFTIGPLLVGRRLIQTLAGNTLSPNDLYAFTVGLHVCGAIGLSTRLAVTYYHILQERGSDIVAGAKAAVPRIYGVIRYGLGLMYVAISFGVILPFLLSVIAELYVTMPVYSYLSTISSAVKSDTAASSAIKKDLSASEQSLPTIFVIQTWTLGLLYLRVLLRVATNYPNRNTRAATAIRAIVRNGFFQPDVRLATRAFVLPMVAILTALLSLPPACAKVMTSIVHVENESTLRDMYRYSYPTFLIIGLAIYGLVGLRKKIDSWQTKVRDEVYLVGERLHNFAEPDLVPSKGKVSTTTEKSKGKARATDAATPAAAPGYDYNPGSSLFGPSYNTPISPTVREDPSIMQHLDLETEPHYLDIDDGAFSA